MLSSGDGKTVARRFTDMVNDAAVTYCEIQHSLGTKHFENKSEIAMEAEKIVDRITGRQGALLGDGGGENRTQVKYFEAFQQVHSKAFLFGQVTSRYILRH